MNVVVIRDLPHVIVEEPSARVFGVGDARQRRPDDVAFVIGQLAAMRSEHRHRHVARITIENSEANGLIELGVPGRRARERAQLAAARAIYFCCHSATISIRGLPKKHGLLKVSSNVPVSPGCNVDGLTTPWSSRHGLP